MSFRVFDRLSSISLYKRFSDCDIREYIDDEALTRIDFMEIYIDFMKSSLNELLS